MITWIRGITSHFWFIYPVLVCECICFILFTYPRVYVNVSIKLKYAKFRILRISAYLLQTVKLAEIVAIRHCLWRFLRLFFSRCFRRVLSGYPRVSVAFSYVVESCWLRLFEDWVLSPYFNLCVNHNNLLHFAHAYSS